MKFNYSWDLHQQKLVQVSAAAMGDKLWRTWEILFETEHPFQRDGRTQQEIRAVPDILQVRKGNETNVINKRKQ